MTNAVLPAATKLKALQDFGAYSGQYWTILDKWGNERPFRLNPAQQAIQAAIDEFRRRGEPVKLRILKARQLGISTYCRLFFLHRCLTRFGQSVLSLADKQDLVQQWLRKCRRNLDELPKSITPSRGATSMNEMWFDRLDSRYFIGSSESATPGMGHVISAVHCSEIASWRNPEDILSDLLPAIPPGPQSVVIQESTGRAVGDWWYQRYYEARRGDSEYEALFLPWYIIPEYRAEPKEILELSEEEKALEKLGLDNQQLAWRRKILRDEFHGDERRFANQFPATEEQAFLSGGQNVFTADQVAQARTTIRPPKWKGELIPHADPKDYHLSKTEVGRLWIWQKPERGRHYAIGADCQWSQEGDYDAAYVECVETGKIVARAHGRWDMGAWAKTLASLGYLYHTAKLAPERNSEAAKGVILPLCGQAGNAWYYPNIFIRTKTVRFVRPKAEDYGWFTGKNKPELVVKTKERIERQPPMDWADEQCVNEMGAYIIDEHNKMRAPDGQYDDRLMARMIAGEVASDYHMELAQQPLEEIWPDMSVNQERIFQHIAKMNEIDRKAELGEPAEW